MIKTFPAFLSIKDGSLDELFAMHVLPCSFYLNVKRERERECVIQAKILASWCTECLTRLWSTFTLSASKFLRTVVTSSSASSGPCFFIKIHTLSCRNITKHMSNPALMKSTINIADESSIIEKPKVCLYVLLKYRPFENT